MSRKAVRLTLGWFIALCLIGAAGITSYLVALELSTPVHGPLPVMVTPQTYSTPRVR